MNDLSLFNSNQKTTTIKELASELHVAEQTVKNAIYELRQVVGGLFDPSKLLWRVINGGNTLFLNEAQATLIKQEIQKHHNLMTTKDIAKALNVSVDTVQNACKTLQTTSENFPKFSQGQRAVYNEEQVTAIKLELQNHSKVNALSPKTTLEKQLIIQQAMQLQAEMIAELQAENEHQKQQLTEQAPKVEMYNELVDRSFCKCLRDTAQFIGEREKHFLQVLQDRKVIYKHAGHYRAYADYADCFELKAYTYGENKTGQQLLVNIKGLELIKKIFKKTQ